MTNVRDLKYVNDEKTYKYFKEHSSGGDITVDDSMSSTSTNPVQNKVITEAVASKTVSIEQQNPPVEGCSATYILSQGDEQLSPKINIPESGGGGGTVVVDDELSTQSTNPVQNKVITNALNSKADSSSLDVLDRKKIDKSSIIDDLGSESSTEVLSARQGKVLDGKIENKENLSNKVTSWSDTASDMKYPSEKLVKDEFTSSDITLEQQATPETGCLATYVIKKGGVALSPKINISEGSVAVDDNTIEKRNGVIRVKSDGVGTQHLKSHCVTSDIIQDGAVDTSELANASVTADKLANNSVTTGKLADNTVTTGKLVDSCVNSDKLADSSVTTGKLVDSCVTTDKINGSAVTTDKLNDGCVNTVKMADNSVTYAKLDANLIADNLTTDDSTKLLSAKQGKILYDLISGIEEDMLL